MANRVRYCPCRYPVLLVPGVMEGVCPGCLHAFTLRQDQVVLEQGGDTWPECDGASAIGDTWAHRNKPYTVFAAVTWEDLRYDCTSTELYLINDAGDEVSLEYELDDDDRTVWWLQEDATDDVKLDAEGVPTYKGTRYPPHSGGELNYRALTSAGAFDSSYDRGELKSVRWYANWKGDLGRRAPRLGRTRELGQDTWFWMTPVAEPVRRSSLEYAQARRSAWYRRNLPVLFGTIGALALATVLHVFTSFNALNQAAYESGPLVTPAQRHWVSEPFELGGRTANVKAEVRVANLGSWFDTSLCLANLETQRRYCIVVELDRDSSAHGTGFKQAGYFSAVPAGRYVLEGQAEADANRAINFEVGLVRDASRPHAFWIALAVLLGAPVAFALASFSGQQLVRQDSETVINVIVVIVFMLIVFWLNWV
jgi:hypothetical protein